MVDTPVKHYNPIEWIVYFVEDRSLSDTENSIEFTELQDRVSDRITSAITALRHSNPNGWLDSLDQSGMRIINDALAPINCRTNRQDDSGAWIVERIDA